MERLVTFEQFAEQKAKQTQAQIEEEVSAKREASANSFKNLLAEFGVASIDELSEEDKPKFNERLGSLTESVNEGKDDFVARYGSANINLKKGYKHHTEDELNDLYSKLGDLVKELKVKDITLVFESVVNEAKKFKAGDKVKILSKSTKKPFDSGTVTAIQKDGNVVVNGTTNFNHEIIVSPDDLIEEEVNEAKRKKVTKQMWAKMDYDQRVNALLSFFKDPDDAEKYGDSDWNNLPNGADGGMYIFESQVNEANVSMKELESFLSQNSDHFGAFVKSGLVINMRPSGSLFIGGRKNEFSIKVEPDTKTIKTSGKPSNKASTSYVEIMYYLKSKLPKFKVEEVSKDVELYNESAITEAEIKSDDEFKEYAFTVLQKAFGEDFDEAKAQEVVDGILGKVDGDYGKAAGILQASLG